MTNDAGRIKSEPLHITTSAERIEARIRKAFTDGLNECRRQYKSRVKSLEKRAEYAEQRLAAVEAETIELRAKLDGKKAAPVLSLSNDLPDQ